MSGKRLCFVIILVTVFTSSCTIQNDAITPNDAPTQKYERLYILNAGKSVLVNSELGIVESWGRYNFKIEVGKNQFDSVKRKDIYVERHPLAWHREDVDNREIRRIAVFYHETKEFEAYSTKCTYNEATGKKFEHYIQTYKNAMAQIRREDYINKFCTRPI